MRLNALHPSDNPMEELLFCFGGGDPGGGSDSGGGSTHPGRPGGESGERGNRSDRGDGNDRDDRGGGGNDRSPAVNPGNIGVGSGASLGATSNQNFSARGAGGPNIGGGSDRGSSMIDSYLDGPMMADISTPMTGGSFVDPTTGRGIMSDIPSMDYGSMAAGANVADPSFDQGSLLGQVTSDGSVFDYSTDDIFGEPTPEQVAQQQYVSGLQAGAPSPSEEIIQFARSIAPPPSVRPTESTRDEQAIQDVQDRNAVRGAADIATGIQTGTMDRGTTITPSDPTNPFGDSIFDSEEANAADLADAKARGNMTMAELAAAARGTPAEQITSQVRGQGSLTTPMDRAVNTYVNEAIDASGAADLAGRSPLASTVAEAPTQSPLSAAADAFNTPVGIEQVRGQVPITRTAPISVPNISPAADIDVAYSNEDLAAAQADLEAARNQAYSDKQFGFDTGLPESIDIFGAKVPTTVGVVEGIADALFDPTSSAANAIAERGIKSVDGVSAEGTANYNPQGLEVVTAGGPLSEGGRTAVYDPSNNLVYDTRSLGGQISDLLTLNRPPENIQALYDRKNAIDDAQRERDGGDGDPSILPPPVPLDDMQYSTPEDYQGRNIVGEATGYVPRGPINYAYTGLPSLAPVALRPSFRARGQYSPLFPVG